MTLLYPVSVVLDQETGTLMESQSLSIKEAETDRGQKPDLFSHQTETGST